MMPVTHRPANPGQLLALVADAVDRSSAFEVVGAGTKRGWGRPVAADARLDLTGLARVLLYEPTERVVAAQPGVTLVELADILAAERQHLAFEPPDFGPLFGAPPGRATLGGAIGCGVAGPRRIAAGAARDHVLGIRAVNGFAEAFRAGGPVAKTATGYDLPRLVTGSFGTLAVLTEVTLKVMPMPDMAETLVLPGLDDTAGVRALITAQQGPCEVSGAAHLPPAVAARFAGPLPSDGRSATVLRLEGFTGTVGARLDRLRADLAGFGPCFLLGADSTGALWQAIRDARCFAGDSAAVLWRLSLPPGSAAGAVAEIQRSLPAEVLYDWGGGLVWLAPVQPGTDGGALAVRTATDRAGGQATLFRASEALRRRVPPFPPLAPAVAALSARLKDSFDPGHIFNPGRLES